MRTRGVDPRPAKVLAAPRAAPGSSAAAIATAAGIPTNTAAATISRLVKQARVRRLEEGGYAPVDIAEPAVAPAPSDAAGTQTPQ